ncbi:MAG TPA: hypothetical protein DDW50_16440, partial [Firmicutes bacterium]|nr:hypothetical protein [Bacillota bacterium]
MINDDQRQSFWQRVLTHKFDFKLVIILVLIASLMSGFIGSIVYTGFFPKENQNFLKAGVTSAPSLVTQIAKKTGPCIVGIRMTVVAPLNQFLSRQTQIEGSGIIIDELGHIMTNYHV